MKEGLQPALPDGFYFFKDNIAFTNFNGPRVGLRVEFDQDKFFAAYEQAKVELPEAPGFVVPRMLEILDPTLLSVGDKLNLVSVKLFPLKSEEPLRGLATRHLSTDQPDWKLSGDEHQTLATALSAKNIDILDFKVDFL